MSVLFVLWSSVGFGADLIDMRPLGQAGTVRNVRVVVEVEGKLKLNADGQEVKHLPLKAHGEMEYAERVLKQAKQWSEVNLVRDYRSASAKITLRNTELPNELRPERRLIGVSVNPERAMLFSPIGPLTREELDLLQAPASNIALEALLPPRVLKIAGQWELPEATVCRLLNLDAASQQRVTCTLDSVKDNLAIVSLEGTIAGAVGGVSSDIELKGKLNFDLKQRAVTWLALACKENRAIGHAQPGFEVVTTLRMVCLPVPAASELRDKALAGLSLQVEPGNSLIEMAVPSAGLQLAHDRRWQAMVEQHDATILRFVDRGDLIAQCNLSRLPAQTSGEAMTLDAFQNEVKRTLGKNYGQLVEASEEANAAGIRGLRVVVSGVTGELPIQWTYYHLSDEQGHRCAAIFTIETNLVERFAQIDRELIGGLRFLEGQEPTLAPAISSIPPLAPSAKPLER